jgi:hypothetical protein
MGLYRPGANTTVLTIQGSARQIWTPTSTTILTDLSIVGSFLNDDGTAALPAYSFTSQPDMGMFRAGADILAWSTAGVERMRLGVGGNLGLGGNATATEKLYVTQSGNVPRIGLEKGGVLTWFVGGDNAGGNNFVWSFNASAALMTFTTDGRLNVGSVGFAGVPFLVRVGANQNFGVASIGGGTSLTAFTDAGSAAPIRIAGQVVVFSGNGGATDQGFLTAAGNWGIGANSSDAPYKLTVGNNVDSGNEIHLRNSAASLSLMTIDNAAGGVAAMIVNDSGSSFIGIASGAAGFAANTKPLTFATGNTERMRIDLSGNVGLGMTPVARLDILGDANGPVSGRIKNTNGGPLAFASWDAQNDANELFQFIMTSDGYTGVTVAGVRCGMLYQPAAGGIALVAATGTIRFAANGVNQLMQLSAAGGLVVEYGNGGTYNTLAVRNTSTVAGSGAQLYIGVASGAAAADPIAYWIIPGQVDYTAGIYHVDNSWNLKLGSTLAGNNGLKLTITGLLYAVQAGTPYTIAMDPGATAASPLPPIGAFVFAQAVGVTGAALSPGGTIGLGAGASLSWQAYTGGAGQTINGGVWRNIGAQSAGGAGMWMRVG